MYLRHPVREQAAAFVAGSAQNRRSSRTGRAEFVLTNGGYIGHLPAEIAYTSTSFTIFEGTSEIQRMIIGRAVTGLNVR
jgi:alkylation response protein AidB-like acyl-CoA dehydrogenase